ncbi:MAG: type II toxin-antitoxin system Y4mF family antitoxin, partial [Nitriliruptorales bacterium]
GRGTMALGASVRRRRRALGLTQEDLADLAEVSVRFVHALEHGKPTVQLEQVLRVLGVLGLGLRVVTGSGVVETDD